MPRIIYLCPADNTPTGGVKVIYRHAELLCSLGADAFVLHPFDTNFRCDWFDHSARTLDSLALDEHTDFVIIPEIYAGVFGPQCQQQRVRYGIFVQNGYITHPILADTPTPVMNAAYYGAALIFVISDDTAEMLTLNYPSLDPDRILKVQYSVNQNFVSVGRADQKSSAQVITYMPRKMASHAARVVFSLSQFLPSSWSISPIHNVDEATCARMLFESRIFLSFSEFEGLPLPPIEAALAGNLVIGYTGQGAREYWMAPNFQEIHQGNVIGFVRAAVNATRDMDAEILRPELLQPGIQTLSDRFSFASETRSVSEMLARIELCA